MKMPGEAPIGEENRSMLCLTCFRGKAGDDARRCKFGKLKKSWSIHGLNNVTLGLFCFNLLQFNFLKPLTKNTLNPLIINEKRNKSHKTNKERR